MESSTPVTAKSVEDTGGKEIPSHPSMEAQSNGTVTRQAGNTDPSEPVQEENMAMQQWKTFTSQSRMSDKGMGLKFIAPELRNGKPIAKLDKNEVSKLSEIWINSIIVYVVGQNPTLTALMSYVKTHWSLVCEPKIFKHEDGYFVVKLTNTEDKDRILISGRHMFYGKPIIVKPWLPSFNFHSEILKVIPIWVKFPNLPLHYWSDDSLSRIGSLLGVPIYADECTSKALRVSFARVLIEMDITKEIPKEIQIVEPNGVTFAQKVTYDCLPPFCSKCSMIGHNCESLQAKAKTQVKVIKKWVPKVLPTAERTEPVTNEVVTEKPHSGDPVVLVDAGLSGDPSTTVDLSMVVTPVNSPTVSAPQEVHDDENQGEWKVVTRKSKDKGKLLAFQSAKAVSYHHSGTNSGIPGGAKGPNPYLS
ncbi:uncharacterized protein LOC104901529 [Beta vulgaris subsp. vulgaris]|uniref:uncharacterized protein LOC104901529 n=1 Tax=Beta vulgaris subsp. vulgaris TaxID=3555 RepID=UPI000540358D|nr:uncharacterized protein LOC104901529 [Beta vulgaris subsp. vulgaris]